MHGNTASMEFGSCRGRYGDFVFSPGARLKTSTTAVDNLVPLAGTETVPNSTSPSHVCGTVNSATTGDFSQEKQYKHTRKSYFQQKFYQLFYAEKFSIHAAPQMAGPTFLVLGGGGMARLFLDLSDISAAAVVLVVVVVTVLDTPVLPAAPETPFVAGGGGGFAIFLDVLVGGGGGDLRLPMSTFVTALPAAFFGGGGGNVGGGGDAWGNCRRLSNQQPPIFQCSHRRFDITLCLEALAAVCTLDFAFFCMGAGAGAGIGVPAWGNCRPFRNQQSPFISK